MRLKLFTVLNFVVRYQSICFACFIKKCFGRVILKTGVKPRFLMSPVLKSVFFINPVRVLWRQVRLFSKVSPSVESGFFSSPGFVRVRVRVRVRSGFRSMPCLAPVTKILEHECRLFWNLPRLVLRLFMPLSYPPPPFLTGYGRIRKLALVRNGGDESPPVHSVAPPLSLDHRYMRHRLLTHT